MLGVLAGAIWDIVSFNDFQIPRFLWGIITSGSAG